MPEERRPSDDPLPATVDRVMVLVRTIPPRSDVQQRAQYLADIERMVRRLGDGTARGDLDTHHEFEAAADALHGATLQLLSDLVKDDPPGDTPAGRLLSGLADAVEAYERATLPPPFGNAAAPNRKWTWAWREPV